MSITTGIDTNTSTSTSTSVPFPYSVKRHGVSLANCDDEPVRTPGCIQGHGLLLALRPLDLVVVQVSENWTAWTGTPLNQVLNRPLASLLGAEAAEEIARIVGTEMVERNPLYALTITLPSGRAGADPVDISVHLSDGVLIVEFEPSGRSQAVASSDGDYYSMVKKTLVRLKAAALLAEFCDVVAQEVRRITQLDRVMIYRFHPDDTGEVVADDHRADLHSWFGLRYPASDIPKPVREIFKRIGVRPLPDVNGDTFEMVPLLNPDSGRPLDMTYCALRGASVMYTDYLRNMGVSATLTMPILRNGEVWGLIACHHYTPVSLPYPVRAAAEFLGQITSLEIASAEGREHLQYRLRMDAAHHAVLATASADGSLAALTDDRPGLLGGIEATGVAVLEHGRWAMRGQTPNEQQLDTLVQWLAHRLEAARSDERTDERTDERNDGRSEEWVLALDALGSQFPEAAQWADAASGVLAIAVSQRLHGDWVIWFRPEQKQTFNWGGNPYEKATSTGIHGDRLSPRKSFEIWQETVNGRSTPWKQVEIDAAVKLRLLLLDIVIGRAEQLAVLNTHLVRSNDELDAFAYVAGHDLKEPLRGIHKYAHFLMEEAQAGRALDERGRERIDSLLRLTVRMDSLLDALLHFSRVGRLSLDQDDAALDEVLADALDSLGGRLEDSGIEVRIPRPLPVVRCDRIRVREIFANLIANAAKYNDKALRWVEIGCIDANDAFRNCVFYVRDNGIGIEARHQERVFMMFKRLHARDDYGGGSGAGLAIVKKLVEQHRGRIWFDSVLGEGSTFYFTLGRGERGASSALHE
jgi:two-component system, chemotaxis family, sensor kinase Cph1